MPNWCENKAIITAPTEQDAIALEVAFNANNLFNHIVPISNDDPECFFKRCALWGTKWEVQMERPAERAGCAVTMYFDTAWEPPLAFYQKLVELGFHAEAYWFEPMMDFCGMLEDGLVDQYRCNPPECIPASIRDAFGGERIDDYFYHEEEED